MTLVVKVVLDNSKLKVWAIKKYGITKSGLNKGIRKAKKMKIDMAEAALAAIRRRNDLRRAKAAFDKRTVRRLAREKVCPICRVQHSPQPPVLRDFAQIPLMPENGQFWLRDALSRTCVPSYQTFTTAIG